MPLISMFRNVHSKTPMKDVEAETIFEDFRNGKWKEPVEDIRRRYREAIGQGMSPDAAKDAIAPLKKKLPAVTFSGRAAKRGNEGIEAHSGLLCIDLDDLGDDVQGIKSRLRKSPHLRFAAISPSGTGVKAIFRVPAHIEAHRKHFLGLHHHVRELLKDDTAIDNSCRDVGRLCFVTYDPEAIDNPEAAEFSAADLSYSSASLHSTSLHPYIPATLHPLHNNGDVLANIREAARAKKALAAKNPRLVKLYVDFVESRFTAAPGGRNEFLTRSIPFLYRAVSPAVALDLVACFYDSNRALFKDPREQHLKEATAMLESVAVTYREGLGELEGAVYNELPENDRDAFRIARDLALLDRSDRERLTFFLSCENLGDRTGAFTQQAQRTLDRLVGYGVLTLTKKGVRRAPGVKPEASWYRWMLPAPEAMASGGSSAAAS